MFHRTEACCALPAANLPAMTGVMPDSRPVAHHYVCKSRIARRVSARYPS